MTCKYSLETIPCDKAQTKEECEACLKQNKCCNCGAFTLIDLRLYGKAHVCGVKA